MKDKLIRVGFFNGIVILISYLFRRFKKIKISDFEKAINPGYSGAVNNHKYELHVRAEQKPK